MKLQWLVLVEDHCGWASNLPSFRLSTSKNGQLFLHFCNQNPIQMGKVGRHKCGDTRDTSSPGEVWRNRVYGVFFREWVQSLLSQKTSHFREFLLGRSLRECVIPSSCEWIRFRWCGFDSAYSKCKTLAFSSEFVAECRHLSIPLQSPGWRAEGSHFIESFSLIT